MSARVTVQFPNIYDTKEVDLPMRDGGISFLDAIRALKHELPESSPPLDQLYITVDGSLWCPKLYSSSEGKVLAASTNNYTETYSTYNPPQFNTSFWGASGSLLPSPVLDVKVLKKSKVVLNYFAIINIVHSCDVNTPVYSIVIPSKAVKCMRSCQQSTNYTYMWHLTLELTSEQYSAERLAEAASWLFIECVVYDAKSNKVYIKESCANFDTLWPCCHYLASLLQIEQLPCKDYLDMPVLQHPITEYHRLRKWGDPALRRLQCLLMDLHTLPPEAVNKKALMGFLTTFLRCCSRTEAAAVRPPSWPYRNPSLIDEDLFLTNSFVGKKNLEICHFIDSYPVVDNVPFLNSQLAPYTVCTEAVAAARLKQFFPMAESLCGKGVLLAGAMCSRLCVEEWLVRPHVGCIEADLFIYGATACKRYKYLKNVVKCIEKHRGYCIKYCVCKNMVRVCMWKLPCSDNGYLSTEDYSTRPRDIELQIIYTNATTKAEVLYNFDSSYLQCGYSQGKFVYTPEYCYFTPKRESLIMRASIQLNRLLKIIARGFLPVLTQPRCCILGTRQDLPPLFCNRDCTFTFVVGKFINACDKNNLQQVKITQNFTSTKVGGNNYCVSNVHYIHLPKRKEKCVDLFHLLKCVKYDDLLLNTYNSYAGCKIVRLNAKKCAIYKKLVSSQCECSIIDCPPCGCLFVSEFDVTADLSREEKILRKEIKADIRKAAQDKIQLYENSLVNGRMIQLLNVTDYGEKYYTYRPPQNDSECKNAVYVVTLDGVDTFPTLEEINSIIAREKQKLTPKIGLAYFDINVRIGERCKNGVKLDGTEVIHLSHDKRFLFANMRSVEDIILQYAKGEDELDCLLKSGASLIIPMKAFYVKTCLEDKYVGPNEQAVCCNQLDPDYTHTAVMHYTQMEDLMYFNIVRVTKDLQYSSSILNDNSIDEKTEQLEESDSDVSSSDESEDESESESDREGRELRYPSENKRKALVQCNATYGVVKTVPVQPQCASNTKTLQVEVERDILISTRESKIVSDQGMSTEAQLQQDIMQVQEDKQVTILSPPSRTSLLSTARGRIQQRQATPFVSAVPSTGEDDDLLVEQDSVPASRRTLLPSMRQSIPVVQEKTPLTAGIPPSSRRTLLPSMRQNTSIPTEEVAVIPSRRSTLPIPTEEVVVIPSRRSTLPILKQNQSAGRPTRSLLSSNRQNMPTGEEIEVIPVRRNLYTATRQSVPANVPTEEEEEVIPVRKNVLSSSKRNTPILVLRSKVIPAKTSTLPSNRKSVLVVGPEAETEKVIPMRTSKYSTFRRSVPPVQEQEEVESPPVRKSSTRINSRSVPVLVQEQDQEEEDVPVQRSRRSVPVLVQEQDQEEEDVPVQRSRRSVPILIQEQQEQDQEDQEQEEDVPVQRSRRSVPVLVQEQDQEEEEDVPVQRSRPLSVRKSASLVQEEQEEKNSQPEETDAPVNAETQAQLDEDEPDISSADLEEYNRGVSDLLHARV